MMKKTRYSDEQTAFALKQGSLHESDFYVR